MFPYFIVSFLPKRFGNILVRSGKLRMIAIVGLPCRLKLSVNLATIEMSFGLSYSNLSPTVILQSAFRMGKLSWFRKLKGSPLLLFIKALNISTSSCIISSIPCFPNPKSRRVLNVNLRCSTQVLPSLKHKKKYLKVYNCYQNLGKYYVLTKTFFSTHLFWKVKVIEWNKKLSYSAHALG